MRIPMAAPLAAFSIGVWAARVAAFHPQQTMTAAAALLGFGALGLLPRRRAAGRAAVLFALILAGAVLGDWEEPVHRDRADKAFAKVRPADDYATRLTGWVSEPPEPLAAADRFVLQAESLFESVPATGGVLVTVYRLPSDPSLRLDYGDEVEFLARVRIPRNYGNPDAFDRVGWLADRGIHLTASVRPGTPVLVSNGSRGRSMAAELWSVRTAARRRLTRLENRAGLAGSRSAAIVRAMTLGDSRDVDHVTRSDFERSGVYHVLVVSGMHVGLLAFVAIGLVRLAGLPKALGSVAGASVGFGYALLLGSSLPASRAAWMLAAYLAATALYRRRQSLNVICVVAMAFLCWEPRWLADVGFQLSFLSVASIAAIGAPLVEAIVTPRRRALTGIWNLDRDLRLPVEVVRRRVATRDWLAPLCTLLKLSPAWADAVLLAPLRFFWAAASLAIVSVVIFIALAAPLAYHFQRLGLAGPIANLAALPLLSVIAPLGFGALLTGWTPFYSVATGAAELLSRAVAGTSAWDALSYEMPPPPLIWIALSLSSCGALAWALGRGRWRAGIAAGAAAGCAAIVVWHPFDSALREGRLELTAIDVGQGDALLVGLPDGRAGLVDAGGQPDFREQATSEFDVGERIVAPYLGARGIRRLAFVAVTHEDADHLDGAAAILRRFRPGELWLPKRVLGREFRELLREAYRLRVRVRFLSGGEQFTIGSVDVAALLCTRCEKRNDRSLVLVLDYGQHRMLLTGDLEQAGERHLVRQLDSRRVAVLKAAHHGSRTSTSDELLEHTQPMLALVSAGFGNLYGHPHAEVLSRLESRSVRVLRTDLSGASTVSSDGRRLYLSSYRGTGIDPSR